jgi:Protein of unknown function (DUF4239)
MGGSGMAGLWLRLALALIVAMVVAIGSVLLANRILPNRVSTGHNSMLSPFLTCVALVYGPLLGFTVVVAWGHFSSADANVAHEASTLTTMYRQTVGMPVPEQTQMRELLRKYAKTVEKQDVGGTPETGQAALTEMYKVLAREQSNAASNATSAGFLGQLTVLSSDRNQRMLDAQPRRPGLLWAGLLVGGVVLVALSGFMRLESTPGHLILSSAIALLLGLLLFIVFWLDHPFENPLGITYAPFQQSLAAFDLIDRGS